MEPFDKEIYLDYAATTPTDQRVVGVMCRYLALDGHFGNANSTHSFGNKANLAIKQARQQVADLIQCAPEEIIWTSGATESNNLALKGLAFANRAKGNHIVTSKIEHKSVIDTCHYLEKIGFAVSYVAPNAKGVIETHAVAAAIKPETILISLMHINNEIGSIQDMAALAKLANNHGILLHIDAAQSIGKLSIDLQKIKLTTMSLSAHKYYGPKGIGALYLSQNYHGNFESQMHGGGQERGYRSGTLPTHQIMGMGEASAIARSELDSNQSRLKVLKEKLIKELRQIPELVFNSDEINGSHNIVNVSFKYVDPKKLMASLANIAISRGSACVATSLEPSYVLKAMGVDESLALSSLRFSMGKYTTETELTDVVDYLKNVIVALRDQSPLWKIYQKKIIGSTSA
jgi:cysteine desulfurase